MSKKYFSIFLVIALFSSAIYYTKEIQTPLLYLFNSIKTTYIDTVDNFNKTIENHFFQQKTIQKLHKKLQQCNENKLIMLQLTSELKDLYTQNNVQLATTPQVQLVRTISYEKFGNFNRLWLDIDDYNGSKIYGLIYKTFVAGIVIEKNKQPLALLNKDIKSTYSVYIGKNKAPGIAHGNNTHYIIINFIPAWYNIKKGDEVTTSGLDTLFFKGLKVGKIISVKQIQGYQSAIVQPYYMAKEPNYFYIIRKVK